MNKGKYNTDTTNAIYKAISLTGIDKYGIKAGCISKDTYYRWMKSKPDFSDLVARAKQKFRDNALAIDHELFMKALESLRKHITDNVETWEKVITHPDGKKTHSITTVKRRGSRWAIELVLSLRNNMPTNKIMEIDFDPLIRAMDMITCLEMEKV